MPTLKRLAAQLPFTEDLEAIRYCAFDRNTPRPCPGSLMAARVYFVLSCDVVPDMMPLVGFTDDAAVLATAIRLVVAHIGLRHRLAARRVLCGRGNRGLCHTGF